MAKIKFALVAAPTFELAVPIPVAGKKPVLVTFTFLHRTKTQIKEYFDANKDADDLDVICGKRDSEDDTERGSAISWELEEPFNRENVEQLLENYPGAGQAIIKAYYEEVSTVRLGNFAR